MRKIVKMVICCILLLVMCLPIVGCSGGHNEKNKNFSLMTVEEVENLVQKEFFDETGRAYTYWWENSWINWAENATWHYTGEDITGFVVQRIKSFEGEESCYLVEFEPTGHYIGSLKNDRLTGEFQPYPSPFKMYNIPQDRRYAYICGSARPSCGIDWQPGYIVHFTGLENVLSDYEMALYGDVFDSAGKKWISNVYLGIYDKESQSWVKETQGEKK